jgi:hypothetical protein
LRNFKLRRVQSRIAELIKQILGFAIAGSVGAARHGA